MDETKRRHESTEIHPHICLNPFASRVRPALAGNLGAVSAAHPSAVSAGQALLAGGGNAVDAVIAAQAVLSVVAPDACGLGGDAFFLVRETTGKVSAVNGAGASARKFCPPAIDGGTSVTVPGIVSAWAELSSRFGRSSLSACLEPAIRLADSGVRVDDHVVEAAHKHRSRLLSGGGRSWPLLKTRTGEVWTQAPLAKCLEEIGRSNGAAFYSGRIADAIVKAVRSHGGVLDNDDLAAHETEIAAPLVVSWKGLTIAIQPPVSQGVLLAVILRNLARTGEIPAGEIDHICVELTEAAFALRDRSFEGEDLLSEELEFDPSRASNRGGPRSYLHTAGVSAVDGQGQVVTSLASVFDDFGSGVFVPETGFVLNNRGDGFTSTPNEYAPGKRPIHTLAPIMVSGSDFCVGLSTPGADGQVQTLLQVLIRWLFDGDLAAAIDSPRWRSEDQSLLVEEGHPAFSQLVECGHLVSVVRGGDVRFGAITSAGMVRSTPFALSDWRRLTWSGVS